jgi:hypothetical protein
MHLDQPWGCCVACYVGPTFKRFCVEYHDESAINPHHKSIEMDVSSASNNIVHEGGIPVSIRPSILRPVYITTIVPSGNYPNFL